MKKSILITRPDYDIATHYLSVWATQTISSAEAHGFSISDLDKNKATSKRFAGVITQMNPSLVILNGHGDEETVLGHDQAPIVKYGINQQLLSGRIVYAISCSSAKTLGPASTDAGAVSYMGYDAEFMFEINTNSGTHPLQDKLATIFLEHSQILLDQLIKEKTVTEAFNKAKNSLRNNYDKYANTKSPDLDIVQKLWWDWQHFVYCGNGEASINS